MKTFISDIVVATGCLLGAIWLFVLRMWPCVPMAVLAGINLAVVLNRLRAGSGWKPEPYPDNRPNF